MALVVSKQNGAKQGSVNARLYALARAASSPFHVTPSGNNSVPGVTGFAADGAGYNLATGLGSVDGALLVNGWGSGVGSDPPRNGCSRFSLLPTRCRPTMRTPSF
jgi:hypothetical protein